MSITTLLFDLDNTLLDFDAAEEAALDKTLRTFGLNPTAEIISRYSEINLAQWKLLEKGLTTVPKLKVERFKNFLAEFKLDFDAVNAARIYESNLADGHKYMPYAKELLEQTCKNYRLYIVTNGISDVQRKRTRESGILNYISDVFISEEIGHNKPSAQYFDYCFSHIPDFRPGETVIIGDSLSSDMKGGVQQGIHTIWLNPRGTKNVSEIIPEFEVSSLSQIPEILNSI